MTRSAMVALAVVVAFALVPSARGAEESRPGRFRIPDDLTIELHARLQPRLELGDVALSRDGTRYAYGDDLYLRRARLSFEGRLLRRLDYEISFEADRTGQGTRGTGVNVLDAVAGYAFAEELEIAVGLQKLPFSRSAFTSASALLLPERPLSVEAAKDVFGGHRQLSLRGSGRFAAGAVTWFGAVADGWERGSIIDDAGTSQLVRRSDPLAVARLELSPPGWTERRRRESHVGAGRHLALGVSAAVQRIHYQAPGNERRRLLEVDVSGHLGPLTGQAELNAWRVDPSLPGQRTLRPRGAYVQGAWLLGSLEPALRLERFEEDSEVSGATVRALTLGVNWYLREHDLKLQAAWTHLLHGRAASTRLGGERAQDLFVVQGQVDL